MPTKLHRVPSGPRNSPKSQRTACRTLGQSLGVLASQVREESAGNSAVLITLLIDTKQKGPILYAISELIPRNYRLADGETVGLFSGLRLLMADSQSSPAERRPTCG